MNSDEAGDPLTYTYGSRSSLTSDREEDRKEIHIFKVKSADSDSNSNSKADDEISQDGLGSPIPPRTLYSLVFGPKVKFSNDAIATQYSVYDDPSVREAYYPIDTYENIHRFDTSFRWNWGEEKVLVRKMDLFIMLWTCVMFIALELDRANIKQALSDNFLGDLDMNTNDYNNGNIIFYCSFLLAELPSQLISKRLGPDRWIPTQIVLWSIVTIFQFFLKNKSSFYVTRALLGVLEGGFIPDVVLYLSYFYTGSELNLRFSFFWISNAVADIFAAFSAVGILKLGGRHGIAGWRYLFLIQGLITLIIGVFSYGMMPSGPTSTASWFRGRNGWFSERQEKIIVNRALRNDPSKGTMHNRQALTPKLLWKAICDYHLWPLYAIGICFMIPYTPPNAYLTLSLKDLGFSTIKTNLLVLPSIFLKMLNMLALTFFSEMVGEKTLVCMGSQFYVLPLLIALYVLSSSTSRWVLYTVSTLLVATPYAHPVQVGWNSQNSNSVRTRTVSASLYNISVQVGSILASFIYRADDAPRYRRGNRDLIAITCLSILLYIFTKIFYVRLNRKREILWNGLTEAEKKNCVENTSDEGNKRLDFRFLH
ncbi:pantothenate transporter liz1 [Schizosaccharomyces octosporus yFS286]|uniref:Pantothenate transporter liz1 n=1 Tax=Schizosaccharomyces octosporus (strain yFS286) TaxID=483514 RepID=S9Q5N9_SCHOY|nr:pantothenate transporter liz1 [Schizosaccharomyces octosporus yFS286]EPX75382.1 pantothenate transporter liz1 [Schizosaccharomyces octosporus yFS286]